MHYAAHSLRLCFISVDIAGFSRDHAEHAEPGGMRRKIAMRPVLFCVLCALLRLNSPDFHGYVLKLAQQQEERTGMDQQKGKTMREPWSLLHP